MRKSILLLVVLLFQQSVLANFSSDSCRSLIQQLSQINLDDNSNIIKRRAFGQNSGPLANAKILQFGFESEYGLSELSGIVEVYGPKSKFGISKDEWFNKPVEERVTWVQENLSELFPESRTDGGLVKLKTDTDLSFLPKSLILDDTGNLEFIFKPLNSFEQWYAAVKKTNELFGAGSMQGTVSVPTNSFFGKDIDGVEANKVLDEKIGMFNFYSEYDILQKLSAAHTRYQSSPDKQVTRNFTHPFLGPMTKAKQKILHSMLKGNAVGEKYEADRLEKISSWENSFKYTGGTVYRPDILGQERVVLEIRDAHKNFSLLSDRMLRSIYFMQHGTSGMDQFKDLVSFDATSDFNKFSDDVKGELARLFPSKLSEEDSQGFDQEYKKALDVFRNFSFPLKDWSKHLETLGKLELETTVRQAQDAYKDKLSEIVGRVKAQSIDDEQARVEIQGALAQFSQSSQLAQAFESYEDNVIFGGENQESHDEFIQEATIEAGPLENSFPEKVLTGDINERMESLKAKFPENIKLAENVNFKWQNSSGGSRNVYILSLKDLTEEQQDNLKEEYLKAVSLNTVSFPLNESAGHLYTRVGKRSYDYLGSVSEREYRFSSQERLETFVSLEADDFMRLRTYLENGTQKSSTVGGFDMQGVTSETNAQLDDNRSTSGEGHNCTSWICTAPIGDNATSLHEIAGAPRSHNIHTNPGWWTTWLNNHGNQNVPFSVFMTYGSISDAETKLKNEGGFEWNFSEH